MIVLGIDPDTTNTGLALVHHFGPGRALPRVISVACASVNSKRCVEWRVVQMAEVIEAALWAGFFGAGRPDLVVVEGQDAYAGRQAHKRPNDLIHLAQVAGMAAAAARPWQSGGLLMPKPSAWKGQVAKAAHQKRILDSLGLQASLKGVDGAEKLTATQKGHVIDAIGLALWGAERALLRTER